VAGESGWMYIRFGISGSAFPATIHRLKTDKVAACIKINQKKSTIFFLIFGYKYWQLSFLELMFFGNTFAQNIGDFALFLELM
jgi:hypothetical protein